MQVFARRELSSLSLSDDQPALLLEGSWDNERSPWPSLDERIQAPHFEKLDREAEMLVDEIVFAADLCAPESPNFADINVLRLRYAALKWLRVIAYVQECRRSENPTSDVELYVSLPRDAEYVVVWQALAICEGFSLMIHSVTEPTPAMSVAPPNAWWRRKLGQALAYRSESNSRSIEKAKVARRILFVGNPRILDDVCDEALAQGGKVAWLYDRFAVGAWLKRRARVRWLICDDDREPTNEFPTRLLRESIVFRGVDLTELVEAWYGVWRERLGEAQTRQWQRIQQHFALERFSNLVVDEDATPFARMAVRHAARHEVKSFVIQHGVCGVRFGYAPLAADRFCAWDEGSRRQMQAWEVSQAKIVVSGSPSQERFVEVTLNKLNDRSASRPPSNDGLVRILLVTITAPRDDRPDSVAFHLTCKTYGEMLHTACAAVAELPNSELIVKLHPRAGECDPVLSRILSLFPELRRRIVAKQPLERTLQDVDCVLSCASTAGLDAAVVGFPVVQLLPRGSGDINPAAWYGLLGSARSLEELRPLLKDAMTTPRREGIPRRAAATKIVGQLHF